MNAQARAFAQPVAEHVVEKRGEGERFSRLENLPELRETILQSQTCEVAASEIASRLMQFLQMSSAHSVSPTKRDINCK